MIYFSSIFFFLNNKNSTTSILHIMRKLDYSRQFVLDFGSLSSKFKTDVPWSMKFLFDTKSIGLSLLLFLSLSVSLSLQFSHYHNHHRLKFSSFLPRNNEVSFFLVQRRRKSFSSGREGKKEEKEEQEEEKGEGGRGTERKGEISRRKIRGEHVKEGKNISRRVVPPPSPPPCRSSRSGASNGEKRKGRGGRERGRGGRRERRGGMVPPRNKSVINRVH